MTNKHYRQWTEFEDNYLHEHYETQTARQISAVLKRSDASIRSRAVKLGLSNKAPYYGNGTGRKLKSWTAEEINYLRTHSHDMTIKAMAHALGRSFHATAKKLYDTGYGKRADGHMKNEYYKKFFTCVETLFEHGFIDDILKNAINEKIERVKHG